MEINATTAIILHLIGIHLKNISIHAQFPIHLCSLYKPPQSSPFLLNTFLQISQAPTILPLLESLSAVCSFKKTYTTPHSFPIPCAVFRSLSAVLTRLYNLSQFPYPLSAVFPISEYLSVDITSSHISSQCLNLFLCF